MSPPPTQTFTCNEGHFSIQGSNLVLELEKAHSLSSERSKPPLSSIRAARGKDVGDRLARSSGSRQFCSFVVSWQSQGTDRSRLHLQYYLPVQLQQPWYEGSTYMMRHFSFPPLPTHLSLLSLFLSCPSLGSWDARHRAAVLGTTATFQSRPPSFLPSHQG